MNLNVSKSFTVTEKRSNEGDEDSYSICSLEDAAARHKNKTKHKQSESGATSTLISHYNEKQDRFMQ